MMKAATAHFPGVGWLVAGVSAVPLMTVVVVVLPVS